MRPGTVAHICNPYKEVEEGERRITAIQGHSGLKVSDIPHIDQ
jgi:hypothetical protein